MKIKIEWTEEVTYRSVVELDQDELREWIGPDGSIEQCTTIGDFLDSGDESVWFDQVDTAADTYAVTERTLVRVIRVVERAWDEVEDGPSNDAWISQAYEAAATPVAPDTGIGMVGR